MWFHFRHNRILQFPDMFIDKKTVFLIWNVLCVVVTSGEWISPWQNWKYAYHLNLHLVHILINKNYSTHRGLFIYFWLSYLLRRIMTISQRCQKSDIKGQLFWLNTCTSEYLNLQSVISDLNPRSTCWFWIWAIVQNRRILSVAVSIH